MRCARSSKLLLALADHFHDAGEGAVLGRFGQRLATHEQAVAHGTAQTIVKSRSLLFDFLTGADHQFGRRRRRGSAEISNEVGDGEIGFVSYGGNDRDLRRQRLCGRGLHC